MAAGLAADHPADMLWPHRLRRHATKLLWSFTRFARTGRPACLCATCRPHRLRRRSTVCLQCGTPSERARGTFCRRCGLPFGLTPRPRRASGVSDLLPDRGDDGRLPSLERLEAGGPRRPRRGTRSAPRRRRRVARSLRQGDRIGSAAGSAVRPRPPVPRDRSDEPAAAVLVRARCDRHGHDPVDPMGAGRGHLWRHARVAGRARRRQGADGALRVPADLDQMLSALPPCSRSTHEHQHEIAPRRRAQRRSDRSPGSRKPYSSALTEPTCLQTWREPLIEMSPGLPGFLDLEAGHADLGVVAGRACRHGGSTRSTVRAREAPPDRSASTGPSTPRVVPR